MLRKQQFSGRSMCRESFPGFGEDDTRRFAEEAAAHRYLPFGITSGSIQTFQKRLHFTFVRTDNPHVC
jgi:hypothetical protein